MTQSPHGGQSAPLSTEFGSVTTPRHSTADENGSTSQWGTTSTSHGEAAPAYPGGPYGGPAYPADAPTQAVPSQPVSSQSVPQFAPPPAAPTPPIGEPRPAGTTRSGRQTKARGPRRARLQLRHINPWTVLKFSCVLSIALFFVWLILVGVLFGVLDASGIVSSINDAVTQLNGPGSKPPITAGIVFGGAAIIGVVNIVLFIALSTIGSVVYNLCADLVGGIEITLSER